MTRRASRRRRKVGLFLFLALSALLLGLSAALTVLAAPLVTAAAPSGIVSFELAGDAARAGRILVSWSPHARERAFLVLGLDFLYLVVYPAWLAVAALALGRRLGGRWRRAAALAAAGAVLAGALDAVENAALLRLLEAGPAGAEAWAAGLAAACAASKFALVAAASLLVLAAAATRVVVGFARRSA